ncbi:hypothetical protein [Phenylobacterium sp.]|jgi:hypothetical protein|uniref:hypothetical protein n=1 Tax=Phenylobacterium sp. TaxID=1871053 RepID=UPI002E2FA645|nr:hypothetical protein [Phenylobacterium sp.]HEX3367408.1 hypothetical protein [Phenylobacterium sp.]
MNISRRRILQTAAPMMIPSAALAAVQDALRGRPGAAGLGPTSFVVGAYAQDPGSMAAWAARGVNTMVSPSDDFAGGNGPLWRQTCHRLGLKMIVGGRHRSDGGLTYAAGASNAFAANQDDPLVIANLLYDEPDILGPPLAAHDAEVAFAQSAGNTKPFFVNYTNNVTGRAYKSLRPATFVNWPSAHWVSSDNYAYQTGDVYAFGDIYGEDGFTGPFSTMSGHAARVLYAGPLHGAPIAHPGRPTFQFLSTSRINNGAPAGQPWRRMTARQYGIQAWSCIINGVSGLLHFSHYMAGSPSQISDDTSAELTSAIAAMVAKVAILQRQPGGNVLMDAVGGGRRSYVLRQGAWSAGGTAGNPIWPDKQPSFAAPVGDQMQAWFEGAEVAVGSETYRLVLNLHDSLPKILDDRRWGLAKVSFAPGQVKCFKASAPTVNIF